MLLRGLAYTMMRRRVSALSRADVIKEIRPALGRVSRTLTAEQFLADASSNGLLVERESDQYSFAHLTFQEYLAAMHIRAKGLTRVLTEVVADAWWRETTLLYTAQSDADPIVRACVADASVPAVALAFDCTEGDSELAPELRDYLDNLLTMVFAPETPTDLRRLMAGVLATRHLRRTVRVGDTGSVCVEPIPAGLYWLFLQDSPGHEPDSAAPVRPGPGKDPVTGVRADDVTAFIRWVNEITGNRATYRLPSTAEIRQSGIHKADTRTPLTAWRAATDGGEPHLWVPPGAPDPHAIDAVTVATQLREDLLRSSVLAARLLVVHAVAALQLLRFGLTKTQRLARSVGRTDMPNLDDALATAKRRSGMITAALGLSQSVEQLLMTLRSERSLDLDHAYALARRFPINLGGGYTVANTLDFPLKLGEDAVRAITGIVNRAVDSDGLGLTEHMVALDLAWSLNVGEAAEAAAAKSATSLNTALTLDAFAGLERCVGTGLGYALASTMQEPAVAGQWWLAFVATLVEQTKLAGGPVREYVVPPGALADKVEEAWKLTMNTDQLATHPWVRQVTTNLREFALPVLRRESEMDGEWPVAIRLAALCLAIEADTNKDRRLGELCREIAAGVTLLQYRRTGDLPATETIILARS